MKHARILLSAAVLAAFAAPAIARTDEFVLPPEQRAERLANVRARDREAAEQKKTGPVVTIVEAGRPKATIVCAEAAGRKEKDPRSRGDRQAARMLQTWIELMSGAKLPVAAERPPQGAAIFVGRAAVDAGCRVSDIPSRSQERIRVRCDGEHVYLAAQSPEATLRAVGRFLEKEFGCRWFADADWGRHYPDQKTLSVRRHEFAEAPGFLYRRIWGAEGAFRNREWNAWNGHGGIDIPMRHSWGFLTRKDYEQHPEWFRLDENGKRVYGPWYNVGHPDVRKRFVEWALAASENGAKGISLSPPDGYRPDFSPESVKYDNPDVIDPTSGRVSMTDRFLSIVNQAAREIYKRNKHALCGFYAYSDYTLPPTRPELAKLSPNLCIWIAPIRYSRYHPLGHPHSPSRQALKEIVDGWASRARMLGWRTYNYNLAEVTTPYSKITTWAHDLPYLHKLGCMGASLESFNTWELSAPHLYLSIRLSYDPALDPWEIMADYWDKAYGPAAEAMETYWMEIDSAFVGLRTETGSIHALHHIYTPARLARLDAQLDQAEQAIAQGTDNQKYRVQLARRGLRRAFYWRAWFDALNRGDVDAVKRVYDEWYAFVQESLERRHTNLYSEKYLRRFVGNTVKSACAAVYPQEAPPRTVIAVLPDEWRTATADEIRNAGAEGKPYDVGFDDSSWRKIKTYSDTRNAQGLPEYFGEIWYRTTYTAPESSPNLMLHFVKADRKVALYVNGNQVNQKEREAFRGASIDVTGHLRPGQENQITVMVRHIPLPEIFLGGLVHPVYLIES